MEISSSHTLVLFITATLSLLVLSIATPSLPAEGIDISLTHVDSAFNLTQIELVRRALTRGDVRLSSLVAARATGGRSFNLITDGNEYYMKVKDLVVDTGSDLFWTSCFKRSATSISFDPQSSSTYTSVLCMSDLCGPYRPPPFMPQCDPKAVCHYELEYADASGTSGVISTDTITLGSRNPVSFPNTLFGCSLNDTGNTVLVDGIVGLGRGDQSIISQLGIKQFSYCLTPFGSSRLVLGRKPGPDDGIPEGETVTVSLVRSEWSSAYNVDLVGITVGTDRLAIPEHAFEISMFSNQGVILDSGTTFTYLVKGVYDLLKSSFEAQTTYAAVDGSGKHFDVCFKSGDVNAKFPGLVFHFGVGSDLSLPQENYMIWLEELRMHCLGIMPVEGMCLLGSYFQHDFKVVHDLVNDKVSFTPAKCVRG
ncbi:Aspartic proteinase nepenthesin-2 [Acorus calamus]|uniref:Aspartic proteinase nepenthesin-2 n=1 Tax=Acorus calamus TaxID=4465 RepID=A0AAV9DPR9_ACOCL|nr:Aspartic proteinase nepenthesin-2 [Acorus calamus]